VGKTGIGVDSREAEGGGRGKNLTILVRGGVRKKRGGAKRTREEGRSKITALGDVQRRPQKGKSLLSSQLRGLIFYLEDPPIRPRMAHFKRLNHSKKEKGKKSKGENAKDIIKRGSQKSGGKGNTSHLSLKRES